MRRLILLRHAKSSWKHADVEDHDRPLNKRGRAAAPVMARWLRDHGHLPDAILCSSSVRTQETVERMRDTAPDLPKPVVTPDLYHAAPAAILSAIRRLSSQAAATGMVVGHEPGMGILARTLAGEDAAKIAAFPTAAAAVFRFDIENWADAAPENARLIAFAKPRDLMA